MSIYIICGKAIFLRMPNPIIIIIIIVIISVYQCDKAFITIFTNASVNASDQHDIVLCLCSNRSHIFANALAHCCIRALNPRWIIIGIIIICRWHRLIILLTNIYIQIIWQTSRRVYMTVNKWTISDGNWWNIYEFDMNMNDILGHELRKIIT